MCGSIVGSVPPFLPSGIVGTSRCRSRGRAARTRGRPCSPAGLDRSPPSPSAAACRARARGTSSPAARPPGAEEAVRDRLRGCPGPGAGSGRPRGSGRRGRSSGRCAWRRGPTVETAFLPTCVARGADVEGEPVDVDAEVAARGVVRVRDLDAVALVGADDERLDRVVAQADGDLAGRLLGAHVGDTVREHVHLAAAGRGRRSG